MNLKKTLKYSFYIIILIFLDQTSKSFFISYLKTQPNYIFQSLPFLDFVYAWNYGISFGLFTNYYHYSNTVFLVINSIIIIYLGYLLTKNKDFLAILAIILIIGGAIGNLIDRIFRGAVFDFISIYYKELYFPAFNLADSFITLGAFIFIYYYYFCKKNLEENHNTR